MAYQLELTQSKPVFLYPVMSARGHLNRDFVTLVDWLAEQKAKHVVATGVLDGVSFSNWKAGFRNDVLDRLVRIILKINALWGSCPQAEWGSGLFVSENLREESLHQ